MVKRQDIVCKALEKTVERITNVKQKHTLGKRLKRHWLLQKEKVSCRLKEAIMNKKDSLTYKQKDGEPCLPV